MRQLAAFINKEIMELSRTGRLAILLIVFVLFGIMGPAFAKLTPWIFEMLGSQLEEQGLAVINMEVSAMTSWEQFYKNISLAMIVMAAMSSTVLTSEYQKGTLVNILTKGMVRHSVILAKTIVTVCVWSICYYMCFAITYLYNSYFWDNGIASNIFEASFCIWLAGVWMLSIIMAASAFFTSGFSVLLCTGAVFGASYLAGILPALAEYVPSRLMGAVSLLKAGPEAAGMGSSMLAAAVLSVINIVTAVIVFNRRRV